MNKPRCNNARLIELDENGNKHEAQEHMTPFTISENTLSMIGSSIKNLRKGKVSEVYDAEKGYEAMIELSKNAEKNDISDMSLEEIDAEIETVRNSKVK